MSSLGFECLNVLYGKQEAVFALTEQVRPGEWLCLIGPNGAGKSSVLRAVAGHGSARPAVAPAETSSHARHARPTLGRT